MADAHLRLRPITEADLPDYVRWFNDPEVAQWLMREPGLTMEQELEWFAQISSPDFPHLRLAIEAEGRHIGGCGLTFREDQRCANFGIHVGEKALWGKGYGTAAVREMLRIGFVERGLHRIQLETWVGNVRAQRCYEKCGFRREGIRRQAYLKSSKWLDVVLMAILREEWEGMGNPPGDGLCPIGPEHVDDVLALWVKTELWPHVGEDRQSVAAALACNQDLALGWRAGGRLIGTAIGAWDGFRGWLYRVAVHPDFRRRGIASSLILQVETRLREKGARQINLLADPRSSVALALYAKLGYEPTEADLLRKRFPVANETPGQSRQEE